MGLDVALGIFILIWAIRGWFRGFLLQAVGLSALVGCVYLANPVRDAARPYAQEYFPAIAPAILDRLLWWGSAVACFVVWSGLGSWIIKIRRRPPYGELEPNRTDQGAGFLFGAAKGAVAASFVASGFVLHAPGHMKPGGVVEAQAKASKALIWVRQYQPAHKIWSSVPVQSFVAHIRRNGLWGEKGVSESTKSGSEPLIGGNEEKPEAPRASSKPVETAVRPPSLRIPGVRRLDPNSPTFRADVERELEALGLRKPDSR